MLKGNGQFVWVCCYGASKQGVGPGVRDNRNEPWVSCGKLIRFNDGHPCSIYTSISYKNGSKSPDLKA